MSTNQCDIGLIGLAVMGENLVLNMESKGFTVAVFNRTWEVTEKFAAGKAKEKNIQPAKTMEEFVAALKRPRKAMIMVKAGAPVDSVIGQLTPLLEKGDVIIDGDRKSTRLNSSHSQISYAVFCLKKKKKKIKNDR